MLRVVMELYPPVTTQHSAVKHTLYTSSTSTSQLITCMGCNSCLHCTNSGIPPSTSRCTLRLVFPLSLNCALFHSHKYLVDVFEVHVHDHALLRGISKQHICADQPLINMPRAGWRLLGSSACGAHLRATSQGGACAAKGTCVTRVIHAIFDLLEDAKHYQNVSTPS